MEQSTKLFLVLGFMFILYTTLNGHLEKYLQIIFSSKKSSGGFNIGKIVDAGAKVASLV